MHLKDQSLKTILFPRKLGVFVLLISLIIISPNQAQQTDPYFKESNGFGFKLIEEDNLNIWWCNGAYKIMQDSPKPNQLGDTIRISAARNEYEPVQIVINSEKRIKNARINSGSFLNHSGIAANLSIEIRNVEYVYVNKPTDSYGYKGWWPDPLPLLENPFTIENGDNYVVWVNFYIPQDTKEGDYRGSLELSFEGRSILIPVLIKVWDFTLPASPSIRSGFGLSVDKIAAYHNITERGELRNTFDLYMQEFKKYKIAPYYPHALYPIKESVTGIAWSGGFFDSRVKKSGRYSYRVEDSEVSRAISASTIDLVKVTYGKEYILEWEAKTDSEDGRFMILVEGFDREGDLSVFENRVGDFKGGQKWKKYSFNLGAADNDVSQFKISMFPVVRTSTGEHTGTAWFDNMALMESGNSQNLLTQGDFEVNTELIDISLDFSEFDIAASRYLDLFGFNSFRLDLKGLGSGTYFSRKEGDFAGFSQGTPEYKILMSSYLELINRHLEIKGWVNKVYIYWFDEPDHRDYPFVREGMNTIKNSAPAISTFLTENNPGPEIMDVTDISCTIWNKIDPTKAKNLQEAGHEYWSYLCTAPKYPWLSEFIDHDAINLRMWLWGSFVYELDGILIWSTNYWTSRDASPDGYLQNPWEEPASFVQGYGWPYGKQTNWGNGDGRFFYPPNRDPNGDKTPYLSGPVPSIRLEFLRQGIEDFEYFTILKKLVSLHEGDQSELIIEANKLLEIPSEIFKDGKTYTKDPLDLLNYRKRVADMIIRLSLGFRSSKMQAFSGL